MSDIQARFQGIKLLALDIDGVMTDGMIYISNHADEFKSFDIQDGFGLVMLKRMGIPTALISGKKSKLNVHRAKDLGIEKIYQNISDKAGTLKKVARELKVELDEVAFVGDDLIDLGAMKLAGVAIAVQNAVADVKAAADYVTQASGGRGAVREIVDHILKAQGRYREVVERFSA